MLVHDGIYAQGTVCYHPSVRLSVCHMGGSVKNGLSQDYAIFTIH